MAKAKESTTLEEVVTPEVAETVVEAPVATNKKEGFLDDIFHPLVPIEIRKKLIKDLGDDITTESEGDIGLFGSLFDDIFGKGKGFRLFLKTRMESPNPKGFPMTVVVPKEYAKTPEDQFRAKKFIAASFMLPTTNFIFSRDFVKEQFERIAVSIGYNK